MLARLLSRRIWTVLNEPAAAGAWPVLRRVLRRCPNVSASAAIISVSLARPVHTHVNVPLSIHRRTIIYRGPVVRALQTVQLTPVGAARVPLAHVTSETHQPSQSVQSVALVRTTNSPVASSAFRERSRLTITPASADRLVLRWKLTAHDRYTARGSATPFWPAASTVAAQSHSAPASHFVPLHRVVNRPPTGVSHLPSTGSSLDFAHTHGLDPRAVDTRALRYWSDSGAAPTTRWEAPDVHRITDHVLRTLDERLVAARERLSAGTRS